MNEDQHDATEPTPDDLAEDDAREESEARQLRELEARPQDFGLRDGFDNGGNENTLHCTCGERLWPDCDVSSASIVDEFQRHLREAHGFSQAAIDAALAESR